MLRRAEEETPGRNTSRFLSAGAEGVGQVSFSPVREVKLVQRQQSPGMETRPHELGMFEMSSLCSVLLKSEHHRGCNLFSPFPEAHHLLLA